MNRIATIAAAASLLTLCVATPATAAPTPPPGDTISPSYYVDPNPTLPNCKAISTANALRFSSYRFTSAGDQSDFATHTGYGTQLNSTHDIIEDGGHSCTYYVNGTKNVLIISVTPASPYDRDRVLTAYRTVFGTTASSIGGANVYVGGDGAIWHETSFLLEDGVWVSGKVRSGGDFFPAVLQDVSDMVYALNH